MKMKPVAVWSPLALCLVAGGAHAALEPFSFGLSETVQHQSNLNHSEDAARVADFFSTTEFRAALDQAIGRNKLAASASLDLNRYRRLHDRNSTGYQGAAEFDWNTVGDLSGAFGADTHRHQYVYGENGDLRPTNGRNLQTDNHVFARAALGGAARWTLFGGVDANRRTFSAASFRSSEEQQWSTNAGTRYATSPDLSFGLTGSYTHGEYPHACPGPLDPATGACTVAEAASRFSLRSVGASTTWRASGNSVLDASLGYTSETADTLSSNRHFVNGSLNWAWTPPSRFKVNLGLKRSSDADTSTTGINTGVVTANNLNGTSVNNVALLDVTYALTAKISLDLAGQYTQRKYADLKQSPSVSGPLPDVNGSNRTSRIYLTVHYLPTRTTELSCGGGRESRKVDDSLRLLTPAYTDNYLQCAAAIRFD